MEFGSGVLDAEAPVDAGLSFVSLYFQSVDLLAEGFLIRQTLPEATAGENAELDFRHPFGKFRTGLSQLPCLGVWWYSSRLAMRRASSAGNAS